MIDASTSTIHQPYYDGNGNVHALVNRSTGAVTAAYEFSAFGETLRATGSFAQSNPFRFSTKYTDDESGLLYFNRRYYDPRNGRFLGRDPIEEKGGLHLYGFVGNNAINRWDYLGMDPYGSPKDAGSKWVEQVTEDGVTYQLTWHAVGSANTEGDELRWSDDPDREPIVVLPKFETKEDRIKDDTFNLSVNFGNSNQNGNVETTGGGITTNSNDAPNNKQLSKSDCDSLASKIGNNQTTLQGIADRTAPPGPSIPRQIWNQLETPGQVSGIARDVWENGYRVTKASLESAGVPMRQIYKNAAPYVNGLNTALTIKDVWQLGVDIHDLDCLGFISHSAETLLGVANFTPGMNLVVLGARIGINSAISDLQQGVDVMEATSVAAANQATAYNVSLGQHNLQAWQQAYENGGCKRFEK